MIFVYHDTNTNNFLATKDSVKACFEVQCASRRDEHFPQPTRIQSSSGTLAYSTTELHLTLPPINLCFTMLISFNYIFI